MLSNVCFHCFEMYFYNKTKVLLIKSVSISIFNKYLFNHFNFCVSDLWAFVTFIVRTAKVVKTLETANVNK